MSAFGGDDRQEKLYDLEQEERRIMQELAEMDGSGGATAGRSSQPPGAAAARQALNALLAECERDVRNAKGYIKSLGPPLVIARCKPAPGTPMPKGATFLSRPKDTGVDFTIPVTLPDYLAVIKQPIFLNNIRDKCKQAKYSNSDEYLEDMRLLARNTASFNKGEDLAWVVQHARLLLEAAEGAVSNRRTEFYNAEQASRTADAAAAAFAANPSAGGGNPGKRKRPSIGSGTYNVGGGTASGNPPDRGAPLSSSATVVVGTRVSVLWAQDGNWYDARAVKKTSTHRAEIEYDDDNSREVLDLRQDQWRHLDPVLAAAAAGATPSGTGGSARGRKGSMDGPVPAAKRQKGVNGAAPVPVGVGVKREDLDDISEVWTVRLESLRNTVLDEMHARFDKIEQAMQAADPMRRVLIAVHDLSDVVTETTNSLSAAIAAIEARIPTVIVPVTAAVAKKANNFVTDVAVDLAPDLSVFPPGITDGVVEAENITNDKNPAAAASITVRKASVDSSGIADESPSADDGAIAQAAEREAALEPFHALDVPTRQPEKSIGRAVDKANALLDDSVKVDAKENDSKSGEELVAMETDVTADKDDVSAPVSAGNEPVDKLEADKSRQSSDGDSAEADVSIGKMDSDSASPTSAEPTNARPKANGNSQMKYTASQMPRGKSPNTTKADKSDAGADFVEEINLGKTSGDEPVREEPRGDITVAIGGENIVGVDSKATRSHLPRPEGSQLSRDDGVVDEVLEGEGVLPARKETSPFAATRR
jgi:Bromodomain